MKQTTSTLLMIKPSHFGYNAETAVSNSFQNQSIHNDPQKIAIDEFNQVVNIFQKQGINILLFDDRSADKTPDSVFPNNWVSFHENGKVVLYPMEARNRRRERRADILKGLTDLLLKVNRGKYSTYKL